MQNNILFDNIYIGHSVDDARKLAEETFFKKHAAEIALEEADKPKVDDKPASPDDLVFKDDPVKYIKEKVELFWAIGQQDWYEAAQHVPEVAGGIAALIVTLLAGLVALLGAFSSPPPAAKKVATDVKEKAKEAKDKVVSAAASGAEAVKSEATKRTTRSQS